MILWRPPGVLRVKVLGLVWRGSQLLAAELPDDNGKILCVRPLGGTIEFGETREQALTREFREELGCSIDIIGPWLAIENIFEHQGVPGHEFVFATDIQLHEPNYYAMDAIEVVEHDQSKCTARWFEPHALPDDVALCPSGLGQLLKERAM
jgi:8-oxo-dGTP pyrophosphatase MutT (NUDIX family)